ncbi:glucose PTS transporter subunit IIA [Bifidobacterium myosotis]|nr:glucose PTS transporter subunit IIA [Bifidobacterium myosotis]
MAMRIVEALGGPGNILEVTHCATRLRIVLADERKADFARIEAIDGVLGAFSRPGGRCQIVIGGAVASVYEAVMAVLASADASAADTSAGGTSATGTPEHRHWPKSARAWAGAALDYVSDAFRPLLGALLGASMVIALANVMVAFGGMPSGDATQGWNLLKAIWEGMFMLLPVMVACNASRKLNVDPWLGGAIMAALMAPRLAGVTGGVTAFGVALPIRDYSGNLIVPLLMAVALALVYHGLARVIASSVQLVFAPFLSLVTVYLLTVLLIGPFGVWIGDGLSAGTAWLDAHVPFLFALLIPMMYPFLVPLGLHWPLNALMLVNIQTLGYDFVQGPMGVWNFACFGATAGVLVLAVRDRDSAMRQTALSALLAGLLGGVSELSLYGIHLQHRRIYRWLLAGCAAGGVSSAVLGSLFPSVLPDGQTVHGVTTTAFAFSSLLTIPVFDRAWVYASSIAIAFVVAMTLVVMFDYRTPMNAVSSVKPGRSADGAVHDAALPDAPISDAEPSDGTPADAGAGVSKAQSSHAVFAPVDGALVGLDTIGDPVFASKALGEGIGVMPSGSDGMMTVCAPVAGMLKTVARTGHAFGIKTDDNVEVLVHVGLDTADMDGEGFVLQVGKGDAVQAGEPVMQVDRHAVVGSGRSMVVVVTVVNSAAMESVTPLLTAPGNGTPLGAGNRNQGESDVSDRQARVVRVGDPIIDVER